MSKILIILFLTFPLVIFSQISEKIKKKADSILISITQERVFDEIFQYNCIESATLIQNTYWYDCADLTHKQKRILKKEIKHANEISYEMVYDCTLLDTMQGLVKIRLDEKGSLIRKSGIPNKENIDDLLSLKISKKKAKEIAENDGFSPGLKPWTIYLTYESQANNSKQYYWKIVNTIILGDKLGCNAKGEILYINAQTGEDRSKSSWETAHTQ